MLRDRVIQYAAEQQGAQPERLWAKFPNYVVLRHPGNRKWYALLMDVERKKLGLPGAETVDILDVRCDPILAGSLRNSKGFLPAYHMNREHWITILLDGTVSQEEIIPLLDMSYGLASGTKPRSAP